MIDVAVVGGGPAGAAAAATCARAGARVVLLQQRSAVNPAEESIGADVVALLRQFARIGISEGTPFAGVMTGTRVAVFGGVNPLAGFHVRRAWLDPVLREAAGNAGADIRLGVEAIRPEQGAAGHLRLITSAGPIMASVVIDASGRRAWLARHFNLPRLRRSPPLIAWRDIVPHGGQAGILARFTPHADGWSWTADTIDGRTIRVRLLAARHEGTSQRPLSPTATAHAASWQRIARLAGNGWFIAGDAAAALDPAYGAGIGFALRSGMGAASAAIACLNDPATAPVIAARYHGAVTDTFEAAVAVLTESYARLGIRVLGWESGSGLGIRVPAGA